LKDSKSIAIKPVTLEQLKLIKAEHRGSMDQIICDLLDKSKRYDLKWQDVTEETYTNLLRRKKYPKESMDVVINRILDGDTDEQPR
jgi:hypothetical protein